MIVAETADGFRFVTQPDHADLAGQFADHWGNGAFARPEPSPAVVVAAYNHDVGWWEYDRRPHLGSDDRPIDFRDMPPSTWIDLYDDGIETVTELDRYAGLLVSMHGAGLRRKRYSLSPDWPDTEPEYEGFVDRQEARQRELLDHLRETGDRTSPADRELLAALHESGSPPDDGGSRLWDNYRMLQAWDELSLSFCTTDDPPAYDEIESVPTTDGSAVTVSIERLGPDEFAVEPYPFETSPLVVSVPVRRVERTTFESEAALLEAYYEANREVVPFTLRRSE